jgi:hypothetical protein
VRRAHEQRKAAVIARPLALGPLAPGVVAGSRVLVTAPDVMRSLDQLYVKNGVVLIVSDASVPYRTTAKMASAYTGDEVARTLRADFAKHGAPLVMRIDNASSHNTPAVIEMLRENGVLVLHGPPRYPQYYGQHERQNREHQRWLVLSAVVDDEELEKMMRALNELAAPVARLGVGRGDLATAAATRHRSRRAARRRPPSRRAPAWASGYKEVCCEIG